MNGITYDKTKDRFRARKTVDGFRIHLGWFKTQEEAEDAISVYTKSHEEADFEPLKQLITTPVTRRWRITAPSFLTRVIDRISR